MAERKFIKIDDDLENIHSPVPLSVELADRLGNKQTFDYTPPGRGDQLMHRAVDQKVNTTTAPGKKKTSNFLSPIMLLFILGVVFTIKN